MKITDLAFIAITIISGCNNENSQREINLIKKETTEDFDKYSGNNKNEFSEPPVSEGNSLIKITSKDINQHIGDSLRVTGFVADVYISDKVAYLNMERKYPKNIFSCAIFSAKYYEFGDMTGFKGKNIEVTGRVTTFKNKIQIILNSKDQIKIIQ